MKPVFSFSSENLALKRPSEVGTFSVPILLPRADSGTSISLLSSASKRLLFFITSAVNFNDFPVFLFYLPIHFNKQMQFQIV